MENPYKRGSKEYELFNLIEMALVGNHKCWGDFDTMRDGRNTLEYLAMIVARSYFEGEKWVEDMIKYGHYLVDEHLEEHVYYDHEKDPYVLDEYGKWEWKEEV